MPNIPTHLIKRAYELYCHHSAGNGVEPDQLQFVSGFAACMGVLTGSLEIGIKQGTPTRDVMVQLMEEVSSIRGEIAVLEQQARERTERMNR